MSQLVRERMETSSIGEDSTRPVNFTALATQTEGYSVTDLKDLVARAVHQAAIRPSEMGDTDEIRVCSIQFGKPASNRLRYRLRCCYPKISPLPKSTSCLTLYAMSSYNARK